MLLNVVVVGVGVLFGWMLARWRTASWFLRSIAVALLAAEIAFALFQSISLWRGP